MTRDDQPKLDPRTAIGHVHLKVAELERAVAFCRDVLGFDVTARLGEQAAFLSAGGYHHHIGLNTWESRGGASPPRESTGLYHFAIRYPTRVALGRAMRRLREHGHPIDGTAHHAVSEAVYLRDPDGHGIELYWDRPEAEWPRGTGGDVLLTVDPLDIEGLLAATGAAGGEDADDAAG
jgi:catechol 2,3-dioxygenase